MLSTSPEKSTNSEVVQLSINTSSVCCPHRLKRVPIQSTGWRLCHPVWRLQAIFFHLAADTCFFFYFFFALPFIIAACSAFIIGSHLFRRWCRHSLHPYKTPHPLAFIRCPAGRKKRREGKEEEEKTLKQTNHSLSSYAVPISTIEEG